MAQGIVPAIDPTSKKFLDDGVVGALAQDDRFVLGTGRVPNGGTAGQILAKRTGADYDTVWATAAAGSGASFPGASIDVATRGFSHTEDNTARYADLVEECRLAGRRILLSDGIWPGTINATDAPAMFDHNSTGYVGHMKGKNALLVDHKVAAEAPVTDVRHVYLPLIGTPVPYGVYGELTLSRENMAANNPQRGDEFWLISDNFFLDPAKNTVVNGQTVLGAADFNGEGLRTYTGDWVTVLGVGIDVTDVAGSGGVRQGGFVTGANSGATAWVSSSVVSSQGQRVAILNDVRAGDGGYFQAGENLTVGDVVRGAISARGPFIVTDRPIETDVSINPAVRKGRTDLPVDLDGFQSIAVGDDFLPADIDQFVGSANRAAAVRLNGVVRGRGVPYAKTTWKHGVEAAAVRRWVGGVRVDKGPAHAEDPEAGWCYAWVNLGGSSLNDLICHGRDLRHVYTNNTRPSNSPNRGQYDYVITKGVSHDNNIHNGSAIGCLDAGFDTHAGSYRETIAYNHIDGFGSGGRTQGRPAGIQMRGFGSLVVGNTITNVVDGVREVSTKFPAPFDMEAIYLNNVMTGVQNIAYDLQAVTKGDETRGRTRIRLHNPEAWLAPNLTYNNTPANPNQQTFIRMDVGWLDVLEPRFYGLRAGAPGYFGISGTTTRPDYVSIVGGVVGRAEGTSDWTVSSTVQPATFTVTKGGGGGTTIIPLEAGQTPPTSIPADTYYVELEAI